MPKWFWNQKPKDDEAPEVSALELVSYTSEDLEIGKKWLQLTRVDGSKFEFFYRKYYDTILIFISGEIRDPDVAQELTNEVFSIAIDRLDKFQWQGYSFGAWLFQIARNVRLSEIRQQRRSVEVPWESEHEDVEDSRDVADQKENADALEFCIENLDPVRRQVFQAFYWSRLKAREIAIVLDMSESNVNNHLLRGKVQLRRCLLENGLERGLSNEKMKMIGEATVEEEGWSLVGDGDEKSS